MREFFMMLGIGYVAFAVVIFIPLFIQWGKDKIRHMKATYAYKKRFHKKPIAKCYCHDCRMWNPETGECADHCNSRLMGSTWFCCFAEPADDDEIIRREKHYD